MVLDLDRKTGFCPKLVLSLSGFGLLSLLIGGYLIGASYLSVSGYSDWGIPGQEMVIWLCLLGVLVMFTSLPGFCFGRSRCGSVAIFLGCGLLVTCIMISLASADAIRRQGFERLSQEAAPLVAAIHEYQEKFGQPPESLEALQVNYPSGHSIKGGVLPKFQYLPGSLAADRYHGNPWVLRLETPIGPLHWDQFLYYPLQNYPSLGHGGWFEKVGSWAYVHD